MRQFCHNTGVDLLIRIEDDADGRHLEELARWLRSQRDLGPVRLTRSTIGTATLGSAFDSIAVAVGSGGVGVALARALSAWFQSRRSDIKITISGTGRQIEVDASRISDPEGLISLIASLDLTEEVDDQSI